MPTYHVSSNFSGPQFICAMTIIVFLLTCLLVDILLFAIRSVLSSISKILNSTVGHLRSNLNYFNILTLFVLFQLAKTSTKTILEIFVSMAGYFSILSWLTISILRNKSWLFDIQSLLHSKVQRKKLSILLKERFK